MTGPDSQTHTLDDLTRKLREIECSRTRQAASEAAKSCCSTGIEGLDRLLPGQGLPAGTLTEWLAGDGAGAGTLAFLTAATRNKALDQAVVVIDPQRRWYAPAVSALRTRLTDTILICPDRPADALWAFEQSLRCSAVAATIGWCDRLHDLAFRRLKLAAEQGGGLGLLLRPETAIREPSWADVRLRVEPLPTLPASPGRRVRVELLRCRGGFHGGDVQLLIDDDVSNSVHLVSELAPAMPLQPAVRA